MSLMPLGKHKIVLNDPAIPHHNKSTIPTAPAMIILICATSESSAV